MWIDPNIGKLEQRRILATTVPGPLSRTRHAQREQHVARGYSLTLPVFVDRAEGAIIRDIDGNQFIDLASGIAVTSVGASAPAVVRRVRDQVGRYTHTCFMVAEYDGFVDVCAALNRLTPGDFEKRTALFNTGAEAVENAVKIARVATGRQAIVVLDHAYHGRSLLTMTMTGKNDPYKQGFGPFAPEVYRVPTAYPFRHPGGPARCAQESLARLREVIVSQIGPANVAAVVAEPIHGEGGFIVPAEGFLPAVAELAAEFGILFVADEVQTGLGRTGRMFACEHEGIVPDLVVTAKALGGGLPLAAVTGRAELMDAVPPGGLGGTYAGNPVACAAALGVIETIESEGLVARAEAIGRRAMARLDQLAADFPEVGEVRGRGAMFAIEFVHPDGQTPNPALAQQVAAHCHTQGVLVLVCGTFGNVLRMLPPLVINDDLLDEALDIVATAVRSTVAGPA